MKPGTKLQPGYVVQLDPRAKNPMFGACFMTITELKPWGAVGYVQGLGANGEPGGQAYYRAEWGEMELCGLAAWTAGEAAEYVSATAPGAWEEGP